MNEPTKQFIVEQTRHMADSLMKLAGRKMDPEWPEMNPEELARKVYEADFALISHDNAEPYPFLNYGNATAQLLWEMSWDTLQHTQSRYTAEPTRLADRERVLQQVKEQGFVDDYEGVRISMTRKRFRIGPATIWNLSDQENQYIGQAAMFKNWKFI
ncbi:MAG: MEKHLA domain-containing protein [Calditrichaceae bacterium]|nr:MEKHLA domain-containing protein [Calditrichaceae bacterium]